MKLGNKVYCISIISILAICLFVSYITRASIIENTYERVSENSKRYNYSKFTTTNYNFNKEFTNKINEESHLIVKGEYTGNRKILYSCVVSEIKLEEVLKGNTSEKFIYVYEPISFYMYTNREEYEGSATSFDGYGLMNEGKKMLLFLKENKPLESIKLDYFDNKVVYKLMTNIGSKIPIEDEDNKVSIVNLDKSEPENFSNLIEYEYIFQNQDILKGYMDIREELLKEWIK